MALAKPSTKGSKTVAGVPPERIEELEKGTASTRNLMEGLAFDLGKLWQNTFHNEGPSVDGLGIVQRMATLGNALSDDQLAKAIAHPSDSVRGWAAYGLAQRFTTLEHDLPKFKVLAEDPHFGVREWAWLALRPFVIQHLDEALIHLQPWTEADHEGARRFVTEITRPRGVWCQKIDRLCKQPELAEPLLRPLKSDPSKYVQNSVGNWLNDAGKSREDWVRNITAHWNRESQTPHTRYIIKRALRNLSS